MSRRSKNKKFKGTLEQSSWFFRVLRRFYAFWEDYFGILSPTFLPIAKPLGLPDLPEAPFSPTADKEAIAELPLANYEGPIYLISHPKDLKKAVRALKRERILGFDTETRPVFRRGEYYPVALLQLTGEHGAYIFQLSFMYRHLKPLRTLLSNPNILKVGVAVRDDVKKLQERVRFKEAGFVEVTQLTQKLGIKHTGLRNLSAILLGVRVSKAAQVSNWALRYLTVAQIYYAATDAWISRLLYLRAVDLLKNQSSE